MASGSSLCQLGLRLNVTVKEQFCQEYLSSEYCSGHGKCLTEIWSKTYHCHCEPPFSGTYCQELDACSYKPCQNNGSCINKSEKRNKQGYECICHPPFTGKTTLKITFYSLKYENKLNLQFINCYLHIFLILFFRMS